MLQKRVFLVNGLVYIDNSYLLDVQNPCAYAYSIYIMKITTLRYREDCLSSSSRFFPAPSDSNASILSASKKPTPFCTVLSFNSNSLAATERRNVLHAGPNDAN